MKVIIDSNIFIASWHKRDQYNEKSISILKKLVSGEIQSVFMTDYVLAEIINFLIKKVPFEIAKEAYDYITKTERIHIVYGDKMMNYEIEKLMLKYKTLSFTDCSLIALGVDFEIKEIYSFDAGFDSVKTIQRKEE